MGLINIFKKKAKDGKLELLNLPYDYDGYDIVFKKGITNPKLYGEFNEIITNNKLSIEDVDKYNDLEKESDEDLYNTFYDAWINKMLENHFAILLDSNVDIEKFATGINSIFVARGENTKIEVNEIVEKYNSELKNYLFNGAEITDKLNYDILEANIVAGELRKYGYELICLFNGYDNDIKTIIRIEDIDKAKRIEEEIKK